MNPMAAVENFGWQRQKVLIIRSGLFLINFHDNDLIFFKVLSLKSFSYLLNTIQAFHLDILK